MKTVITISREFGSGGHAIGKAIAQKLGIPFYDKELLSIAAKQSGMQEDLFVKYDESHSNSFLYSLVMGNYAPTADGRLPSDNMPLNHKIFLAQFETIKTLAQQPCVIVGRCADYVLKDDPDAVNFFITGNIVDKKQRILERYDIEKNKVEDFIRKTDKRREAYHNYYTERAWGEAKNYDLCLNSSKTGIDGAVDIILKYIELKNK